MNSEFFTSLIDIKNLRKWWSELPVEQKQWILVSTYEDLENFYLKIASKSFKHIDQDYLYYKITQSRETVSYLEENGGFPIDFDLDLHMSESNQENFQEFGGEILLCLTNFDIDYWNDVFESQNGVNDMPDKKLIRIVSTFFASMPIWKFEEKFS